MPVETFVLNEKMDLDAPIYQRVNEDQRVKVIKRPNWSPFLQITVQDADGVTKNLRYKESSELTDLDEQIEKKKIPANAKYTNSERNDLRFRNGVLVTAKVNLQRYLKDYPGCEGSPYTSEDVPFPVYKVFNKANVNKILNAETRLRVKAASKIFELDLAQAQAMLVRLNGSFFETPKAEDYGGDVEAATEAAQNLLTEFVDATNEEGLNAVLKEDTTADEEAKMLIGNLLNNKVLEFDLTEGKVFKNKGGKKVELKSITAETYEEMQRLFSEFLNTDGGKALKSDLEKDAKKIK